MKAGRGKAASARSLGRTPVRGLNSSCLSWYAHRVDLHAGLLRATADERRPGTPGRVLLNSAAVGVDEKGGARSS